MFKIPAHGPVWQSKHAYNAGLKRFPSEFNIYA